MKLNPKRLNKHERERHQGAATELIERLEHRLAAGQLAKHKNAHERLLAERVGACRKQLEAGLRDSDLMRLNLELADLFYRSNNADKRKRPQLH